MGFFSNLLKTAGVFVEAAVYAAGTVAAYVGAKVAKFVAVARDAYNDYKIKNLDSAKRDINSTLENINGMIIDLESKLKYNGKLSPYENHQLDELYEKRRQMIDEKSSINEIGTAKEIAENSSDFDDVVIDDSKVHILQFHVGQTVSNKLCPQCKRPMQVQWRIGKSHAGLGDLFWGCTGFYENTCHRTLPFTSADFNLFTKVNREEFQMTADDFNSVVMVPSSQKSISKRVSELKNEPVDIYSCPIHGSELVLREKRGAIGLLDQYFLGCPLWNDQKTGCNYVMKLKSGAQLASLLESKTGRGIL